MSATSAIEEPHKVIDALFDQHIQQNSGSKPDGDFGVESHFKSIITDANIANIPLVTQHAMNFGHLRPGTLVRYRGMVQDTFDSEFCPSVYKGTDSAGNSKFFNGMYRDVVNVPEGITLAEESMTTRIPVYMVPVPGETEWAQREAGAVQVQQRSAAPPASPAGGTPSRKRRANDDDDASVHAPQHGAGVLGSPASVASKRGRGGDEEDADVALQGGASAPAAAPAGTMQVLGATAEEANSSEPMHHGAELTRHMPLRDDGGMPAIVRMYSPDQPLRVGEMAEVVGILTVSPDDALVGAGLPQPGDTPAMTAVRQAWAMDKETAAKRPSNSLVARIQGLVYRKLPSTSPMLKVPMHEAGAFKLRGTHEHELALIAGPQLAAATSQEQRKKVQEAAKRALAADVQSTKALQASAAQALAGFAQTLGGPLAQLRQRVVGFLAAAAGGDAVAGEWLLLHLISSVTTRVGEEAVGMLHLNLTGCPDCAEGAPTTTLPPKPAGSAAAGSGDGETEQAPSTVEVPPGSLLSHCSATGRRLHEALSALMPRVGALPLTVAHLNSLLLFPRKDYVTNRLLAGMFQLPAGTHMVVDETVMNAGTLLGRGIENHTALTHMLAAGTLTYDFGYFPQHFPIDVPKLLLSHTKSLFTPTAVLPLSAEASAALASGSAPALAADEHMLDAARKYLACVRCLPYSIDEGMGPRIQQDWSNARARNPKLQTQDLHRWLTIARLVALSFGETVLQTQHWEATITLEDARLGRLPSAPAVENPGAASPHRANTPVSPVAVEGGALSAVPPSPGSAGLASPSPVRPPTGGSQGGVGGN